MSSCCTYARRNQLFVRVRYSAWDAGSVEMADCGGGAAVEVAGRRVILEGGMIPHLQLDEHRLAFS